MAEPITQARLRALAAVHPDQGRVLSVFLNLDPTQFATAAARSSAITSVMTDAAHKVEESDGLTHDERMELRDDVERVRDVLLGSDIAANGTRAVAVYACGPEDLLEVVRLRRPVDNRVVLDRTACVEPLIVQGTDERWMVLLCNRRAARLFFGPGDALEETDRFVDDVHQQHDQGGWSQLNYQRSIDKDVSDHVGSAAELAFEIYKTRGLDRVLIGAPEELLGDFKGKLHPYLRERIAGKFGVDIENASLDDVRAEAGRAIEAHMRKCEREALDRLVEAVGRGGRGAAGIEQVLDALNQARVETLL
ncbi:MAG TPA: Vms1/Ankzf1 family peptidyl-tRNA hydrolase, partial [Solirubrobacter sp.]|nr:Vms1/Ankzf1 family peptidyl-tRNA hydrolase [Solirubrobacter sp.]